MLTRALWVAMAVYAGGLTLLGIDRYATYHAGLDLGLFVQSIQDAAHGFHNRPEYGSHWAIHFSPILWLGVLPLAVTRSPIGLIALQAAAGALVAPAIFLIARRRVDDRLASMMAIVSLLYPPLVGVTFADFHENGFAPAVVAWLLWAVDGRRFGLAWLFAALALCIKEDEALVLFVLGAGYAIYRATRADRAGAVFGATVCTMSAIVFAAYFGLVRTWGGASGPWPIFQYYTSGAVTDSGMLSGIWFRLSYVLEALIPLLFLPLRSPAIVLAIPGFVEVLASRWSITYTMGQHYPGVWVGYVLVAFVLALAAIARNNPATAQRLAQWCMVVCVLILIFASPTHWGHFLGVPGPHERALNRSVGEVPARAVVCAVDEVYTHLAMDPNAQPGYDGRCDFMIVDQRYDSPTWRATYSAQVAAHLRSQRYDLVSRDDGVLLYRRKT